MRHETLPNERKKATKGKKRKANDEDSEAAVPESDLVTLQIDETDTNTKAKKKNEAESCEEENTSQQEAPPGAEDEKGLDDEDDLTPEEKRVLERKLKKIRKMEEKKKLRGEGKIIKKPVVQKSGAEKEALEYLACWSEKREEWKFVKRKQTWLLQHMYDTTKVTDDDFKMLLAYIESIRGLARDTTLQKAEAIVRWEGQEEESHTEDAEKKKQRAKQVVQLL
ncbi:protein cholesin [Garra rufa]|uniref:protein cholesin n=1 Tax=Garra rufa TaxID=137080 RepID=UPI003CCEE481